MNISNISQLTEKHQTKLKKNLSANLWYHATTFDNLESLLEGVNVNYNANNPLDFGPGFYLSNSLEASKEYVDRSRAYDVSDSLFLDKSDMSEPVVITYKTPDLWQLFQQNQNVIFEVFPSFTDEFAKFVLKCRLSPSKRVHDYKLIFGVQTDSNPLNVVESFIDNLISEDEAITELKKSTSGKQLYIGDQSICNQLVICDILKRDNETKEWHHVRK